jgi:hypothetical protein
MARRATIDISELAPFFEEFGLTMEEIMWDVNKEMAKEGEKEAKQLAYNRMPSYGGTYRNRFRIQSERKGDLYISILRNLHRFASHVEVGTKPHWIEKEDGYMDINPVLDYGGEGEAPWGTRYKYDVHTKKQRVWHPGARAFYILRDAARIMAGRFADIFEKVWGNKFT